MGGSIEGRSGNDQVMRCNFRYGFPQLVSRFAALALLTGMLAGCEHRAPAVISGGLDTKKAERDISKSASKQVGEKITVSCPRGVKLQLGLETVCHATDAHGRTQRLRMRQTDTTGHTSWTLIRDLNTVKLEKGIIRIGAKMGFKISQAACPADVEIVANTHFSCTLSLTGQSVSLPAMETDDQGNVQFNWNALPKNA